MTKRPFRTKARSYKVGKGRPPLATRWKPGHSGNPKGRPKGSKNLTTLFDDALNQRLEIQENGKIRTISAKEGIVRRVVNQALKGDLKATAFVLAKEPEIQRKIAAKKPFSTDGMNAKEIYDAYITMVKGSSDDDE